MQEKTKRDMILDAMQELMNESSGNAISVSDIARKAGIGKGSIYYYFPSKDDIMEAVIERSYSMAIEKSKDHSQYLCFQKNGNHLPGLY